VHRIFALCLTLCACLTLRAETARPPNLLFVFADDWGRHAGVYARVDGPGGVNDLVTTPHFDALAGRGVLFRRAFVSAPSCTPCRSALLTGQAFYRTGRGAILQGARWDDALPVYPLLLRDAGFDIGKSGKVWSPGTPVDQPYGGQQHAFQQAGGRFNQFSQYVTQQVAKGVPREQAKAELYREVRENFRRFLAAREGDRPFCYWWGPTNVHRKWVRGSGLALWDLNPDGLKGKMPPFLPDVPEIREDLADYFGEVAALDAGLGALLEELRASGEAERTLIVVSGDHGAPGFPHGKCHVYDFGAAVPLVVAGPGVRGGRVVDDLVSLTDLAPTFLEAAGQPVPAVMTGRSLWNVLRAGSAGRVDPARDHVVIGRERHVEIARPGHLPYPTRALRTETHLFIVNFRPERYPAGDPYRLEEGPEPTYQQLVDNTMVTLPDEDSGPTKAWMVAHRHDPQWKAHFALAYGKRPREELYELATDPHQVRNLAAEPAHAATVAALRERLFEILRRTGDPRLVDDGAYFEQPPLAGPLPDDVNKPRR
jgi:arylsulfatase A-like enzyme